MDLSPFFWGRMGIFPLPTGKGKIPHPPVRSPGDLGSKTVPPSQIQLQPPPRLSGFSGTSYFEDLLVSPWKNPIPSLFMEFFHLQDFQQSFLPLPFLSTRITESISLLSSRSLHLKAHPRGSPQAGITEMWDLAAPSPLSAAQNPQNIPGSASLLDQRFSSVSFSSLIPISFHGSPAIPWISS